MNKKSKNENRYAKYLLSLISFLVTILIFTGTLLTFYYAKGYRINIYNKAITKTGVLTVKTSPFLTDVYVSDKSIGKSTTSKGRTLDVGSYNIKVKKDRFQTWQKNVNVVEEKNSILDAWLNLENPKTSVVWDSERIYQKHWVSKNNDTAIFLLKDSNNSYSLWTYKINSFFLNFNSNLTKVLEYGEEFDIQPSPNCSKAILTVKNENEQNKKYYVIDTSSTTSLQNAQALDLENFSEYTVNWSNDNSYLVLESKEQILSYSLTNRNISLLKKKNIENEKCVWTTDENGFFYWVQEEQSDTKDVYQYSVEQMKLNGTNSMKVITAIYFQSNTEYIEYYRNNSYIPTPSVSSPENTKTVGEIIEISVNQKANGIFIKTTSATYWYNISTKKYLMISPYQVELIGYSTDQDKLLYKNGDTYGIFTFDPDVANPIEDLGSKVIENLSSHQRIAWVYGHEYIYLLDKNNIHSMDIDGDNKNLIVNSTEIKDFITGSISEEIVTIQVTPTGRLELIKYSVQ